LEEIDKDTKRFMPRFLMFIKWNYWICICSPSTRQHCFPLFLFSALLSSPLQLQMYCAIHCLPTYCVMQIGFVNSLALAKSGKFLVAGVGQVICLHFGEGK
jgi:hypothetical protein